MHHLLPLTINQALPTEARSRPRSRLKHSTPPNESPSIQARTASRQCLDWLVACKRCAVEFPRRSHRCRLADLFAFCASFAQFARWRVWAEGRWPLLRLYAAGAHVPGLDSTRSIQKLTVGTDWSHQVRSKLLLSIDTRRLASGLAIATGSTYAAPFAPSWSLLSANIISTPPPLFSSRVAPEPTAGWRTRRLRPLVFFPPWWPDTPIRSLDRSNARVDRSFFDPTPDLRSHLILSFPNPPTPHGNPTHRPGPRPSSARRPSSRLNPREQAGRGQPRAGSGDRGKERGHKRSTGAAHL